MQCGATRCNTLKNGLKIRRGQPRGGSTPPPGTKPFDLNEVDLERDADVGGCRFIRGQGDAETGGFLHKE